MFTERALRPAVVDRRLPRRVRPWPGTDVTPGARVREGRHRGRSGRVTAPPGRPTGGGVTFSTPTVDGMVDTVLRALRAMVTTEAEGRAIGIEVWADQLAASVYAPGSSPPEMHADLAAGLRSSSDPDAPAALAALATCLVGTEAAPLRDAHAEALAERGPTTGATSASVGPRRSPPTRSATSRATG